MFVLSLEGKSKGVVDEKGGESTKEASLKDRKTVMRLTERNSNRQNEY